MRPLTYFSEDDIFTDYLLHPLNAWGLLEMRYQKEKGYSKVSHVRTNPLFKKFIHFNTTP